MEMENLRNDWNSAKSNINCNACGTSGIRRNTSVGRISATYLQLSIIAFLTGSWGWRPLYIVTGDNLAISIAFSAFLFLCSGMSLFLYFRMRSIKCSTMSLSEVARRARGVRRSHLRFMLVSIPSAIAFLVFLGFAIAKEDETQLFTMLAGATLGLILGLRIFFRTMRDYRDILDE